jgi:hypothetical protein
MYHPDGTINALVRVIKFRLDADLPSIDMIKTLIIQKEREALLARKQTVANAINWFLNRGRRFTPIFPDEMLKLVARYVGCDQRVQIEMDQAIFS